MRNLCKIMKYRCLWLLFLCFLVDGAYGQIHNGGFEVYEPNTPPGINSPVGWMCENYATVDCNFIPDPNPREGESINWETDWLESSEGHSFLILSTGDIRPEPCQSKVWQRASFAAGQKLYGSYFFGTYDYTPYDDFGQIKLTEPNNHEDISAIILAEIDVSDVSSYGSMEGWDTFSHIFTAEDAGEYDLVLIIKDVRDCSFNSYFMVDGIDVCWVPEHGDINTDCHVNLEDFSFLAHDWLMYDPNYATDPNFAIEFDTDLDGTGFVDVNDLYIMSDYWLTAGGAP